MKKVKSSADDMNPKQGQELSKKLYRTISEQAKRLDDARSCARTVGDLFTPILQIQRKKFCDYCEKLIFSEPVLYGRKGEELLWRKGYYDVVSTAKKLTTTTKKQFTQSDMFNLQAHINAAVGFYHHFISKLQCEFNLNLKNIVDFSVDLVDANKLNKNNYNDASIQWAYHSVHQCLIYLGDLNRYKLDVCPNLKPVLAFRYYLQAISYQPDYGMPHNQMGTLAMSHNNYLDAVYYYMRCLACKVTFDGTINNLHSLFEKNSKFFEQLPEENNSTVLNCLIQSDVITDNNIKGFLARFMLLIDIWYFNKKVSKVYSLCHQTYKDLEECLSYYLKPLAGDTICESPTIPSIELSESSLITSQLLLNNDMLFKLVVICLLCISKLQKIHSHQVSTVVAFTLAIYSLLLQNIINHIQDSVLNYPLPEDDEAKPKHLKANGIVKELFKNEKKKRKKSKLRRRKVLKNDSESDQSEDDENNCEVNSSDNDSLYMSDADDVLVAESSEDELVDLKKSSSIDGIIVNNNGDFTQINGNKPVDIFKKVQRMDINDMLEIITEEGTLQSIKIINDWLKSNVDIIKSCGSNTRSLLRQITNLLNLININLIGDGGDQKLSGVELNIVDVLSGEDTIPLSEDVILKGFDLLTSPHSNLNWNYMSKAGINTKEETVIRIIKLMSFGKFLTGIEETGISFDENENIFICAPNGEEETKVTGAVMDELDAENGPVINNNNNNNKVEEKESETKGQLMKMKHMGQLWLAAEVKALESRVRDKASLSPYLVLDADALIKYTFMVKQLVNSRKFIVLIPTAVVSALDDLKREQSEARDAIRWLEAQFHRGNRFFRAQRPQEKTAIPFIKYPKKKDKEMCVYIQIIECCHFLAEQQKGASNLVTLLIGNQNVLSNGENKELSYVGLAQSAGVAIESITQFYSKWKKSHKEKR